MERAKFVDDLPTQFFSSLSPQKMRIWAMVYGLFLITGLCFWFYGERGNWYHDEFGFWGNVLFYVLMWRLIRGIRLRVFKLEDHVWMLEFRESSHEVHFLCHKRLFRHHEASFDLDETTCVIHKSDIPRLYYQLAGLRYTYKTDGSGMIIMKYLILLFSISLGGIVDLFLKDGPAGKSMAQYLYGPTETALDLRPTAVSFVKGKNEKSLILLPTYGWKQEKLAEIVEVCQDHTVRVFDKRPHREKQEDAFI